MKINSNLYKKIRMVLVFRVLNSSRFYIPSSWLPTVKCSGAEKQCLVHLSVSLYAVQCSSVTACVVTFRIITTSKQLVAMVCVFVCSALHTTKHLFCEPPYRLSFIYTGRHNTRCECMRFYYIFMTFYPFFIHSFIPSNGSFYRLSEYCS